MSRPIDHPLRFDHLNVLIVGDVMLDHDIVGRVDRVSPEADVPVVVQDSERFRPGGAANVAVNVGALGARPLLVSMVGRDEQGKRLEELLRDHEIPPRYILQSVQRPTTVKTRVLDGSRHVLRVDREVSHDLDASGRDRLRTTIENVLNQVTIHVAILQDYDKGILGPENVPDILAMLHERDIPVAVDPKFRDVVAYRGADLIKPNLRELAAVHGTDIDPTDDDALFDALASVRDRLDARRLVTTLSAHGIAGLSDEERVRLPAIERSIVDVSGAGDTVIAMAALLLATGADLHTLCALSNLAGGAVCEHSGVVALDVEALREEVRRKT